jgi:hypothetical protein
MIRPERRPQFRLETLLGLTTVICIVVAAFQARDDWRLFSTIVAAAGPVMGRLTAGRPYGYLLGVVIGLYFELSALGLLILHGLLTEMNPVVRLALMTLVTLATLCGGYAGGLIVSSTRPVNRQD